MSRTFILLGAGHWHAPWHARALHGAGQRVVGFSGEGGPARRLAGEYGLDLTPDWRTLLAAFPLAVPVVLTRPDETPDVLAALVEGRRPFVLEKPGTVDAAALRPAAEAALRLSVPSLVPLLNRRLDFWNELETLSARQCPWSYAHFRILAGPPARYRRDEVDWVLQPAASGGGALRNLGIHAADAALQLAGGLDLTVETAVVSRRLHGEAVEDFAAATLRLADGRCITIEAGYCMPTETSADKEWRAHGPGWAVSERNGFVEVRDGAGLASRPSQASAAHYAAFGATMADFAAGAPAALADIADLVRAQHLVDTVYAAARRDG